LPFEFFQFFVAILVAWIRRVETKKKEDSELSLYELAGRSLKKAEIVYFAPKGYESTKPRGTIPMIIMNETETYNFKKSTTRQ
jgi:hypothetical protein